MVWKYPPLRPGVDAVSNTREHMTGASAAGNVREWYNLIQFCSAENNLKLLLWNCET